MASKWPQAWRSLSKQQKEAYAKWRHARDGEQAFYWYIQEVGNAPAGVRGQHYIKRAVGMWQPIAQTRVKHYLEAALNVSQT